MPCFADRVPCRWWLLAFGAVALAVYPFAVAAIGIGGAPGAMLQTRPMDVTGDAQGLAPALNPSAFNTANVPGPWLAGLALGGPAIRVVERRSPAGARRLPAVA